MFHLVNGDPESDGEKTFEVTDEFWEWWNETGADNCKAHGFHITKRDDDWIGHYHPYAPYAAGTIRLKREVASKCELSE